MLPRYTTNITGLRHWCCGSSFTQRIVERLPEDAPA